MLTDVLAHGLPTALCTVYYLRFPEAAFQRMAVAGLTVFDDCIVRAAFARGLPLLDLRLTCAEEGDYANLIEPSAQGGEKIARAIAELVEHGFTRARLRCSPERDAAPRGSRDASTSPALRSET